MASKKFNNFSGANKNKLRGAKKSVEALSLIIMAEPFLEGVI
jgi:hypothetical protein